MKNTIVVGSGASGVHFALSLLKKGYDVTMLDVGYQKSEVLNPKDSFIELKANLDDTVSYFLGTDFEAFISPDHDSEYYGFPPSKNYVFSTPSQFSYSSKGFLPLFSFARGGLAEAWTGGAYPLNDEELIKFPFSYNELKPYYERVAHRIGISGTRDDLEIFYPFHNGIMAPLELDPNSSRILSTYTRKRKYINEKFHFYMGRSRVATLSQDMNGRKACSSKGRCIWGCPGEALYTPSLTLEECKKYSNFKYFPDTYVRYFDYNTDGHIKSVIAESIKDGKHFELLLDKLVLAAGTLSSSKIFLESIYRKTNKIVKLRGLMDNRQILVPFLNLKMLGKQPILDAYQYHQLAIYLNSKKENESIHGQITTCKSAMIHPIIKSIPCDLKTGIHIFRKFHSALGLINLNFSDFRRNSNYLSLKTEKQSDDSSLMINYRSRSGEKQKLLQAIKTLKKVFFNLGCIVPPGMVHIRPMGASVHYCGTVPMSDKKLPFTTSKNCQSHDFSNLYFADGTTLPFLPAKNLTFTLMANAIRIAENAF